MLGAKNISCRGRGIKNGCCENICVKEKKSKHSVNFFICRSPMRTAVMLFQGTVTCIPYMYKKWEKTS